MSIHKASLFALLTTALLAAPACDSAADNAPEATVSEPAPATDKAADAAKADASAEARSLALVADKSSIEFVGAKVTADHRGKFGTPKGSLQLAGKDQVKTMSVEVDTTELQIEPAKLGEHLKSPDFFDVAKYPSASFTLTSVAAKAGDKGATHEVTGQLELRGVKKTVTFPATVTFGESGVDASAVFKINRKDFGITYAGMADDLIKDDVVLDLKLSFA